MKGSAFNLETRILNYVTPDPDLQKCVKHGVEEEQKTHFDLNPKAARMGSYWRKKNRPDTASYNRNSRYNNS